MAEVGVGAGAGVEVVVVVGAEVVVGVGVGVGVKNDPPNAEQKRWREDVRGFGSIISARPAVIHHVAGRTAKFNKVSIGHWYILPLTPAEHNIRHSKGRKAFVDLYGTEKLLFQNLCRFYRRMKGADLPFDDEVYQAIMDYRK